MGSIGQKISNGFIRRYQIVVRNVENFSEKTTITFGYNSLIIALLLFFTLLCGCSLALSRTLLSRWLNPLHAEEENREKLFKLAETITLLEKETAQQAHFITILQDIIKGKTTPTALPAKEPKEKRITYNHTQELPTSTPMLDEELSQEKVFTAALVNTPQTNHISDNIFFTPIEAGIITTQFNDKTEHYGVDIVAKDKSPIKCIASGVVIFSDWTVERGWTIAVQHTHLVSIYKHCAKLFKKVGNVVNGGEVIAIMGNSGELSSGPHLHFEIWNDNTALNPEFLF